MGQKLIDGEDSPNWNIAFDGLMLAHKPQQLDDVGEFLKSKLPARPNFIISILLVKLSLISKSIF